MTDSHVPTIAFLGIGLMGRPMAANLLATGYRVTVWNRSPGKTATLVDAGARARLVRHTSSTRALSRSRTGLSNSTAFSISQR